jgi:hypothetical protein
VCRIKIKYIITCSSMSIYCSMRESVCENKRERENDYNSDVESWSKSAKKVERTKVWENITICYTVGRNFETFNTCRPDVNIYIIWLILIQSSNHIKPPWWENKYTRVENILQEDVNVIDLETGTTEQYNMEYKEGIQYTTIYEWCRHVTIYGENTTEEKDG